MWAVKGTACHMPSLALSAMAGVGFSLAADAYLEPLRV
jgi:hypothetical protein